ncbi:acyl-homoserine-lactone synthase TraI [Pararhizobium sp. LjRoot255]|jgi:N-acyl-L-homoserine lactone synthetase|uniref:acyl-homoserine-lactone synthase n=1 Tax=Pararhizobium sp. LjRoot255 TaxID=3342298 RepID=UPI003ED006BC
MRIVAVQGAPSNAERGFLDAMHRLRSRVFGGRLQWQVTNTDGLEFDQFDHLSPTYILALTIRDEVIGCARLLPATGPTMLQRVFHPLLAEGYLGAHDGMIESSRFCVDTAIYEGRGAGPLHEATLTMFAGIIEWCVIHGFTEIVTATDFRVERILRRAGWPMRRLGEPQMISQTKSVAGLLPADRASFERVRPEGYRSNFSLSRDYAA